MADLTVKDVVLSGVAPGSYPSAASGGDQCENPGTVFLHAVNGDGSPHDVQVDSGFSKYGKDVDPDPVTVPAGEERMLGPFPRDEFGSTLSWTYPTGVTGLTVQPFRLSGVVPSS